LWPEIVDAVKNRRRLTWIQLSQHAQAVGLDGKTLTVGFNNAGARESFVNGRSDLILQQVIIDLVGQDWRVEAIVDPSAQPGQPQPGQAQPGQVQPGQVQPGQVQSGQTQRGRSQTGQGRPAPSQPAGAGSTAPAEAAGLEAPPKGGRDVRTGTPPAEPPDWAVAPPAGAAEPGNDAKPGNRSAGARDAIRQTRPSGAPRSLAEPGGTGDARPADEDAHRDDPEIEALDTAQLLTQRLGAQVIEEIPHG
jgi:DNA polymerase-3 subunit gamma/tau